MINNTVRIPFRFGLWTGLISLALIVLGDFGPTLRTKIKDTTSEVTRQVGLWSLDDARYHPEVGLKPEQELGLIHRVNDQIEPQLLRAEILVRKQQAESGYLKELSRIIEERFADRWATEEVKDGDWKTHLQKLVTQAASKDGMSKDLRDRFDQLGGNRWGAYQQRIALLETSLSKIAAIQGRVHELNTRLHDRRKSTLRFLPPDSKYLVEGRRGTITPETEQCEKLLEKCHEELFRTLYALDAGLVEESKATVQLSSFTPSAGNRSQH